MEAAPMRITRLFACLALFALSAVAQDWGAAAANAARDAAPQAMHSILAADLAAHLNELASDAYEGRLTGTAGQRKAADYIIKRFESLGLKPLGDKTSDAPDAPRQWLQHYPVHIRSVLAGSGVFGADDKPVTQHGAWVLPKDIAEAALDVSAEPLFLGRIKKGDLEGKDLSKCIPVVSVPMDTSADEGMTVNDAMMKGMMVEFGAVRQAASLLSAAGAKCAIIVTRKLNKPFLSAANMMAVFPGKPEVSMKQSAMGAMSMTARAKIPVLVVGGPDADALLAAMGVDADALDRGVQAHAGPTKLHLVLKAEEGKSTATNVAAYLPGRDTAVADEALVYSAHMDHVGMAPDGQAFNGADDNGSGTASILEIAEAYSQLKGDERPRRSIIFLSVSGEELGLWGSEWFANNPTWPLEKLIANVNIDMIGRSTASVPTTAISVTPTWRHKQYSTLTRDAAFLGQAFDLNLANGDRFYTRSDHYNFAKKGVPVVFFCDDEHADYHMTSDDPDKIEVAKVERIVRMAFLLGLRAANADKRPETIGAHTDWFGEKKPPKAAKSDK